MFRLEAILDDKFIDNRIQKTKVLVLEIINKKDLTRVITYLNSKLPLNQISLSHLKRIDSKKRCQIIVSPINATVGDLKEEDVIKQTLSEHDTEFCAYIEQFGHENLRLCDVPSFPPLTRSQFEQASRLWPVNFHEDKYLASCLNGTSFSEDDSNLIYQLIGEVLALVKPTHHPIGEVCSRDPCGRVSVVITKHGGRHEVTRAISTTERHPLQHAVINAVSQVAEIHRQAKCPDLDGSPLAAEYKEDYLCTNYECFLSQEPCMMCAMALVHSRIKRVFFYQHGESSDAECHQCRDWPYTLHKLHLNANLNHRYEVWKVTPNHHVADNKNDVFPNKKLKS